MVKIVAFGGSAGSFETFGEILPTLPTGLALAYVFITHLPRTHVSQIPDLFAKFTEMPVYCADAHRNVEPDSLFVIAPQTFLFLKGNRLVPQTRRPEDTNQAVNYFFESLAAERGPEAVGVVLSGAGSDGTRGLRAIREAGGATFTQDPATARFAGMPRSAVRAGVAGQVFSPDQLAFHLFRSLRHRGKLLFAS
jgi:two-component system, chemotaxis family, CheB/CheR fusion protein